MPSQRDLRWIVVTGGLLAWLVVLTLGQLRAHSSDKDVLVARELRILDSSGHARLIARAEADEVRLTLLRPDGSVGLDLYVTEFDEEYHARHSQPRLFPEVEQPLLAIGAGSEGAGALLAGKELGIPRYARAAMFGDGSTRFSWTRLTHGKQMRLPGYASSTEAEAARTALSDLWLAIDPSGRVHLGESAREALRNPR